MAGDQNSSESEITAELWRAVEAADRAGPGQRSDAEPVLSRAAARLAGLGARAASAQALIELAEDKDWSTPPSVKPRVVRALEHLIDAADRGANAEALELTDRLESELAFELEGHREFRRSRGELEKRRTLTGADFENALNEARRSTRASIQERRYLAGRTWWARLKESLGIN